MQRFYGGDPAGWAGMPTGWLRAYAEMLPRLRDEEQMRVIAAGAATGTMTEHDRDAYLASLQASQPAPPRRERGTLADLAQLGIPVTMVGGDD